MHLANPARIKRRSILFTLLLCGTLVACGSPSNKVTSSPVVELLPTSTALPTASPTPQPAYLLLVAPSAPDPAFLAGLQGLLENAAQVNGLTFEIRPELTQSDAASQTIRLAVVVSPGLNLADLASAAPQIQFLAIGYPGLQPQANLSVIELQPSRADWEGFVAGFLAATVTNDWRVGVVSDTSTVEGKAAQNGFANGVKYMCGLCQPLYPPFPIPTYPLYWSLSPTSSQADMDTGVAYFQEWAVKTVFLYKPSEGWLSTFGKAGFRLIGDQTPPEELKGQWIASIQNSDLLVELKSMLPALLNGKGGQTSRSGLTLININADLFSPGKQEFVKDMLTDLLSGKIDSGVDPNSGELK